MEVPNSKAGAIIGKNGDNLRQICQKTQANIFMPQDGSGDWRIVEISGEEQHIAAARRELEYIIRHGPSNAEYEQEAEPLPPNMQQLAQAAHQFASGAHN
jgi:polyribonucleotide nucleotidyltransferase